MNEETIGVGEVKEIEATDQLTVGGEGSMKSFFGIYLTLPEYGSLAPFDHNVVADEKSEVRLIIGDTRFDLTYAEFYDGLNDMLVKHSKKAS